MKIVAPAFIAFLCILCPAQADPILKFTQMVENAYKGHIPSQKKLYEYYRRQNDDVRTYVWAHIYETNGIGDAAETIEYLYTLPPETTLEARNLMAQIFVAGYADYPYNEDLDVVPLPVNYTYSLDPEDTKNHFLKAAKGGHIIANYILGHLYENGLLFEKDDNTARDHFKVAADKGHPMALKHLARITEKINGR